MPISIPCQWTDASAAWQPKSRNAMQRAWDALPPTAPARPTPGAPQTLKVESQLLRGADTLVGCRGEKCIIVKGSLSHLGAPVKAQMKEETRLETRILSPDPEPSEQQCITLLFS